MKKIFFSLGIPLLMAGTMLTSCQSSSNKVENAADKVQEAKDNVVDAQLELNQAIHDSIQQFKKESKEKISAYEKNIAEFKAKRAKEKKENRAEYEKKLAELEQKTSDMKKNLENYNEATQDKWDAFRLKFKQDMDEVGKELENFMVKGK